MARARKSGRSSAKRRPKKPRRPAPALAQRLQRLKKTAIIRSMSRGATKASAAAAAGVNASTLWRWEQADPKFAEKVFNAERKCIQQVEGALFRNALKPGAEGRIDRLFYLKTRAGYVERGVERQIELRAGYYEHAAQRHSAPEEPNQAPREFKFQITARKEHPEPKDADDDG